MVYCPRCGAEIPEGGQFCPKCGSQVVDPAIPYYSWRASARPKEKRNWWIIPIIMMAVIVLAAIVGEAGRNEGTVNTAQTSGGTAKKAVEKKDVAFNVTYSDLQLWEHGSGSIYAYTIYQVQNVGDESIYMDSVPYELEADDGTIVATGSLSVSPNVIVPGGFGYAYDLASLDMTEAKIHATPHFEAHKAKISPQSLTVANLSSSVDDMWHWAIIRGRVHNETDSDMSIVEVDAILRDSDGKLIAVLSTNVSDVKAGGSMGFEITSALMSDDLPDRIATYEVIAYEWEYQFDFD